MRNSHTARCEPSKQASYVFPSFLTKKEHPWKEMCLKCLSDTLSFKYLPSVSQWSTNNTTKMPDWRALWHRFTMFVHTGGDSSGEEVRAVYHQAEDGERPGLVEEWAAGSSGPWTLYHHKRSSWATLIHFQLLYSEMSTFRVKRVTHVSGLLNLSTRQIHSSGVLPTLIITIKVITASSPFYCGLKSHPKSRCWTDYIERQTHLSSIYWKISSSHPFEVSRVLEWRLLVVIYSFWYYSKNNWVMWPALTIQMAK